MTAFFLLPRVAVAQDADDEITVRGRRRNDQCVTLEGTLGPHGLPRDAAVMLRNDRLVLTPGSLPPTLRLSPDSDSPRARIDRVALHRSLPVARRSLELLRGRFSRLVSEGRVGQSGNLVAAWARFRLREPLPIIGNAALQFTVEARNCPIAYELPTPYGPTSCVGRRVLLLVGRSSRAAGFIQGMALDYCFQEARGVHVQRRSWLVRGETRSMLPMVSEERVLEFLSQQSERSLREISDGILLEANLSERPDTEPQREEPPPPAAPELPTPTNCVLPIRAATQRYFELTHLVQARTEPWDLSLSNALWTFHGRLSEPARRSLAVPRVLRWGGIAIEETLAQTNAGLEALLRSFAPNTSCEVLRDQMGPMFACRRGQTRPPYTVSLVREPAANERFPHGHRPLGVGVRLCETFPEPRRGIWWEQQRNTLERRQCATLWYTFTQEQNGFAPWITHDAVAEDFLEPDDRQSPRLRLEVSSSDRSPLERFVQQALMARGQRACVPFVRPLCWSDGPCRESASTR